jgi:hypothetical protein
MRRAATGDQVPSAAIRVSTPSPATSSTPLNVNLREREILPAVDTWLARALEPDQIEATIAAMAAAITARSTPITQTHAVLEAAIADCDNRLARYKAMLDAGGDPESAAAWTREAQAEKAAAQAMLRSAAASATQGMSAGEIRRILANLGDLPAVIRGADAEHKADVYRQVNLRLAYHPGIRIVRAEACLGSHKHWATGCVRGGTEPVALPDVALAGALTLPHR